MEPITFYNSIDSYTVSFREINDSTPKIAAEITNTSRVLYKLREDATYEVIVRAFTVSTFLGRGLLQGEASFPQQFVMSYIPPTSGLTPGGTVKPREDAGRVVGVVFALFVLLGLILGVLGFVVLR
nr:uncharacterized protein LOC129256227 [Lytechinus pictus]